MDSGTPAGTSGPLGSVEAVEQLAERGKWNRLAVPPRLALRAAVDDGPKADAGQQARDPVEGGEPVVKRHPDLPAILILVLGGA